MHLACLDTTVREGAQGHCETSVELTCEVKGKVMDRLWHNEFKGRRPIGPGSEGLQCKAEGRAWVSLCMESCQGKMRLRLALQGEQESDKHLLTIYGMQHLELMYFIYSEGTKNL